MAVGGLITWGTIKARINSLCENVVDLKNRVIEVEKKQVEIQLTLLKDLGAIRETVARIDERQQNAANG
jgi:hypothetical protein